MCIYMYIHTYTYMYTYLFTYMHSYIHTTKYMEEIYGYMELANLSKFLYDYN
jgi:hypothetical protein